MESEAREIPITGARVRVDPSQHPHPNEPQPPQAPGHAPVAEAGSRVQQLRAAVDAARAEAGQDEAACRKTLIEALRTFVAEEDVQPGA